MIDSRKMRQVKRMKYVLLEAMILSKKYVFGFLMGIKEFKEVGVYSIQDTFLRK